MLMAFGLLRGDTLGVIGELTGNDELQAAGWKINAAAVRAAVRLLRGRARAGHQAAAGPEAREARARDIGELDKRIAEAQRQAEEAARTVVAADDTVAKLDRELARVREGSRHGPSSATSAPTTSGRSSASEPNSASTGWRSVRRPPNCPSARRPSAPRSGRFRGVEPGDVIDAVIEHARVTEISRVTDGADHMRVFLTVITVVCGDDGGRAAGRLRRLATDHRLGGEHNRSWSRSSWPTSRPRR